VIFYNEKTKKYWFKSFGSKDSALKGSKGISKKSNNHYLGEDLCLYKFYNISGLKQKKPFVINSKGFDKKYWDSLKKIIKRHKC
jgi:hypothetical protein